MPYDDVYPEGANEGAVLDTVEAAVRATLNEVVEKYWLTTQLDSWAKEAVVDISIKALCVETRFRMNLVAGQNMYTEYDQVGISSLAFLHTAWYDDGKDLRSLQKIHPRHMHKYDGERVPETASGEPFYVSLFGQQDVESKILVFPKPTAAEETIAQVTTITCVADVADSLDGLYFLLSTPTVDYYVWIDVDDDGTSDPALEGKTGIEVVGIVTGDTATAVAAAITTVIDAVTGLTATSVLGVITVTNDAVGSVAAARDPNIVGKATGFTFEVTTSGGKEVVLLASKITSDITEIPDAYRVLVIDYVIHRAYMKEKAFGAAISAYQKYITGLTINMGNFFDREVDSVDKLKIPDFSQKQGG
jgi:hypothetical protein